MKELGFITQEEYDKAVVEVVTFKPQQTTGIKAPHFVFFLTEALEEKYGEDLITTGGLKLFQHLITHYNKKLKKLSKNTHLKTKKHTKPKMQDLSQLIQNRTDSDNGRI